MKGVIMKSLPKWVGLMATTAFGVGLLCPAAAQAEQGQAARPYTLRITSVYVHDDGDPGFRCGDIRAYRWVKINSTEVLKPDNGHSWTYNTQDYCSDSLYDMPQDLGEGVNVYHGHRKVGESVTLNATFSEYDFWSANVVSASNDHQLVIPGIGTKKEFAVQVEGTEDGSHLRMTLHFEIKVS